MATIVVLVRQPQCVATTGVRVRFRVTLACGIGTPIPIANNAVCSYCWCPYFHISNCSVAALLPILFLPLVLLVIMAFFFFCLCIAATMVV